VPWTNIIAGGGLRIGRRAVVEACRASIGRLGVGSIDVYSLHAPLPYIGGRRALYEGLAEAYDLGLCRSVGMCNFSPTELTHAHRHCRQLGLPIVSNQFRYSLMNIEHEVDGTIETCLELGIAPVAHTPLAGGLATAFYARALSRRNGRRGRVGRFDTSQLLPLSLMYESMSVIAEELSSGPLTSPADAISEAQIALRYVMAKGCTPLPGVNNAEQALEVASTLDVELDHTQLEMLDQQARHLYSRRAELPWLKSL